MNGIEALLERLLKDGLDGKTYSAASACVGRGDEILAGATVGTLYEGGPAADADTRFDMASVTKIIGPTMLSLMALDEGRLTLFDTVGRFLDAPEEQADITVRDLLTHTSGLLPHVLLSEQGRLPEEAAELILRLPPAGERGVVRYSCLGFIVLGRILEKVFGRPLGELVRERVLAPLGMNATGYNPRGGNIASTSLDPVTGDPVMGLVNDENALFLGGVSANAGIFSTAGDMAKYASMLAAGGRGLVSPAVFQKALRNYTPGQDQHRGLGFHLGGSDGCYLGDLLPDVSFGHTGFTGTSVAVDPTTGFFAVILTNRTFLTRDNPAHLRFRRRAHNALYAAFQREYIH